MNTKIKDLILIICFILFGILTRTVWHIAPNVEFVTAFSIAGAYFIRKNYSLTIPFGIMVISDLILGNSLVFIFTWSAFAFAWVLGKILKSKKIYRLFRNLPKLLRIGVLSELSGILFTIFFFFWTNLGVVVVSNLYPKTLEGVIQSYIMGIPFLLPQLFGNIIIVPAIFIITHFAYKEDIKWIKSVIFKVIGREE